MHIYLFLHIYMHLCKKTFIGVYVFLFTNTFTNTLPSIFPNTFTNTFANISTNAFANTSLTDRDGGGGGPAHQVFFAANASAKSASQGDCKGFRKGVRNQPKRRKSCTFIYYCTCICIYVRKHLLVYMFFIYEHLHEHPSKHLSRRRYEYQCKPILNRS